MADFPEGMWKVTQSRGGTPTVTIGARDKSGIFKVAAVNPVGEGTGVFVTQDFQDIMFRIKWASGSVGLYSAELRSDGVLVGSTSEVGNPGNVSGWSATPQS